MTVSTRYIDTHAHVHCAHFDEDRETVINNAIAEGVERIVEIGYDLPSSRAAIALAEQSPHIYAVVGIQPNHAHEAPSDWLQQVQELAEHPRVVAIGEIGLDYYRDYAPRDMQARFFIEQLQFARQRGLPVVIHTREAWADTVRILQEHARGQPGIMHSFSGNWEVAQACLDVGFLLSFSGPVTFPKARDLHAAAQQVPLDHLLVETDSPYLSPHPYRGKRNEPSRVRLVAERIASLREVAIEEVAHAVWTNAQRVFHFTEK